MKPKYLISLLPIIAVLTGCGQNDVNIGGNKDSLAGAQLTATPLNLVVYPNDRPSIPDGKPVFAQNCASCHGDTGGGGGQAAVKFDETWAHQIKPVDIYRIVAFGYFKGHPKFNDAQHAHPAFVEKLSVRQLWDVCLYTRSLGQPALIDAQISDIDPVFGSNCAVCHGTKGDGDGPLARNLEPMPANFQRFDRFYNRTDDVLFDHIANGIRWEGMPNFLGKQDRKKNIKFDEPYVRKLVQYVHKFHVNNAPVLTANAGSSGTPDTLGTKGTQQSTSAPTPAGAAGSAGTQNNSTNNAGAAGR